jgi:hypothetical protein
MIISLDIRDYTEVQHMFRRYPRNIFGLAMPYTPAANFCGTLAQGENLFICAHGDASSIGNPAGDPRFSAAELALWLENAVLPCNYAGDVYIAAPGAQQSYINDLRSALGDEFRHRVHGQFNLAYSQILPPGREDWVNAA